MDNINFSQFSQIDVEYPDRHAYAKALREEIDNTPMTAKEREEAIKKISERSFNWFNEAVKPYLAEKAKKEEDFWRRCREHFGYDKYLTETGVSKLEYEAYDRGHSAGFSEVYCELCRLVEFIESIRKHFKDEK